MCVPLKCELWYIHRIHRGNNFISKVTPTAVLPTAGTLHSQRPLLATNHTFAHALSGWGRWVLQIWFTDHKFINLCRLDLQHFIFRTVGSLFTKPLQRLWSNKIDSLNNSSPSETSQGCMPLASPIHLLQMKFARGRWVMQIWFTDHKFINLWILQHFIFSSVHSLQLFLIITVHWGRHRGNCSANSSHATQLQTWGSPSLLHLTWLEEDDAFLDQTWKKTFTTKSIVYSYNIIEGCCEFYNIIAK